MRSTIIGLALIASAATAIGADTFIVDQSASSVEFTIQHFGFDTVYGSFGEFSGRLEFAGDPRSFSAQASVAVESIDTGITLRDSVLQGEDYFHSERFPTIAYRSTGLQRRGSDWVLTGMLTIRDVQRAVELILDAAPRIPPQGSGRPERLVFSGQGTLDRTEFGITPPGMANRLIGRTVSVAVTVEGVARQ